MAEKYDYQIIKPEEKDELLKSNARKLMFDRKANIHGICIELLTDDKDFKETWEDNFYYMGEEIRPHGRIVAIKDEKNGAVRVLYEPASKTCFLFNCDYYGWVKSFALGVAADFLEEYVSIHSRFSVHGSCIDFSGRGVALIATSGTGKTTHSFGLLLLDRAKLISDDWFFVKLSGDDVIAYSSERNSYITDDIGKFWKVFQPLVDKTKLDKRGRGVANVEDVIGGFKKRRLTVVKKIIILKKDASDQTIIRKMGPEEAVEYLASVNLCNPYQMVKDERKLRLRKEFFLQMFRNTEVYMLNTFRPVEDTHKEVRKLVEGI